MEEHSNYLFCGPCPLFSLITRPSTLLPRHFLFLLPHHGDRISASVSLIIAAVNGGGGGIIFLTRLNRAFIKFI